jgi:hypothetical protein
MAMNEGILVVAPIRPQYDTDVYSVAYSNEIRGGFHSVTSSTDRDGIYPDRRQWGMLCHVIDENKTYQLKLNYFDSDLNQNANWVQYEPNTDMSVWSENVIDFISSVPGSPNDGDRYIIGSPSFGAFLTQSNNIAVYSSVLSGWEFTEPVDQTTVRISNHPNQLAIFYGTQSISGRWVREYQNAVRYIEPSSTNGLTYSFSSLTQSQLFTYSNVVYYASFATANTGTVSLSIDGLEFVDVRKVSSNSLTNLSSGDIVSGIQYQLTYNSPYFQITLPTDGTTQIGLPEFGGGYTQGLYQDITTTTPVGTVIDRFNELFKYLTPPSAPALDSWNVNSRNQFITGKISFDGTGGFTPGTASIWNPTATGGLFATSTSGYVLGIRSSFTQPITGTQYYQDITGILNSDVTLQGSKPTAAYLANSFGNGASGSLYLYLNTSTVSSINLGATGYHAIDTTLSGATSGFNLSAATNSKYELGYEFDFYWNRTGSYRIKRDNPFFVDGLNYIQVVHNFGSTALTLNRYEFISDSSNTITTYATPQGTNYNSTFKFISGLKHINNMNFKYDVEALNIYRNTYYPNFDAGVFGDPIDLVTPNPASQSLTIPSSISSTFTFSTTYTIKNSRRRVDEPITVNVTTKRTVQGTTIGGTLSVTGWLIDTFATSSTVLIESFDDEQYRLVNGGYASHSLVSGLSSSQWNSQSSLYLSNDYRDALQVLGGTLVYPKINFSNFGNNITNLNYGLSYSNYALCASSTVNNIHGSFSRSYTRYYVVPTQRSSIRLNLTTTGTNIVPVGTSLNTSTSQIYLEFKLPYKGSELPPGGTVSDGGVTGWMDAGKGFLPGQYENGAGCWDQTNSATASIAVTFGVKNTYFSNGIILMRITTGPNYTGQILSAIVNPN